MKVDHYRLIEQCVENGIRTGLHRAHKNIEDPTEEQIADKISQAIMHEICEWFRFEDVQ